MILLRQGDPRWGFKTIGNSKSTLSQYGCTITSISMLSDWYKCFKDPSWLAKNLRFLNDLVIWQSVTEKLCFKFVWRQYGRNDAKILASLKGKNTSCLLQVYGRHWVVGIRKVGWYYYTADPYTGTRRWYPASAVSGSAHFSK